MLPTTIDSEGRATAQQHSCCLIIDDCVAIDAGSLGMAASDLQKKQVRNVILTHAHLDHIAGLPLFIDDLFAILETPVTIHALPQVIEALESHIFNWVIYPRFRELNNKNGEVMRYSAFESGTAKQVAHLKIKAVEVNHKVPSCGFIISDGKSKFAISGDTAEMSNFWEAVNAEENIRAILIECAFPDKLDDLAESSHHLTPKKLKTELLKIKQHKCPMYVINMKPMYRNVIVSELRDLEIENLRILDIGRIYEF